MVLCSYLKMDQRKYELNNWKFQFKIWASFVLDDDDTLLCTFFVVRNDKKKWAWLSMMRFTLDDKKIMSFSSSVKGPLVFA